MELRCPDPSCNPYLALAVCLAAGLDGIEKGMTPPPEITDNIFAMTPATRKRRGIEALPGSLEEALVYLKKDKLIMNTLVSMWPPSISPARRPSGTSTVPCLQLGAGQVHDQLLIAPPTQTISAGGA